MGSKGGFKRKDHLTQHVREVHKHLPEPKPRAYPVVAAECSRESGPTDLAPPSESKKRKRASESISRNANELMEELLEERGKNQRLQKEIDHERETHKEREDKLLNIIASLSERGRS